MIIKIERGCNCAKINTIGSRQHNLADYAIRIMIIHACDTEAGLFTVCIDATNKIIFSNNC